MSTVLPRRQGRATLLGERGFSLLETLIAMLILAVGLLGLAAMQTMALGYNVDAHELTAATTLASEMMERIHANRLNVTDYNGALGTGIDTQNNGTAPPAAQVVARGDFFQWQASMANANLDNAQGLVNVTSPIGPPALNQSQVVVEIRWTTEAHGVGSDEFGRAQKLSRLARVRLRMVMTPP